MERGINESGHGRVLPAEIRQRAQELVTPADRAVYRGEARGVIRDARIQVVLFALDKDSLSARSRGVNTDLYQALTRSVTEIISSVERNPLRR